MKKKSGKTLMQKWKNKIGGKLSALDKKKLVLTNIPYALAAFYADRAFFLYRNSPGEDMGNKLLYAMEHADRIFDGFVLSNNWKDLLAGIVVAVVLKVLVWQKQADAKKLRKGIEYGSARWGTAEDIKPYMSEDPWMNIPLTATEALTMESRPKQPKYARNKNIVVIGGSGSGKTRFFVKPSVMQMNCSMVITDPKGTLIEECGKMLAKGPPKKDKNGNIMKDKSGKVVHEPYVIKVLNTINFSKSLHYNPFAYIRSEKDILKLVTTIIVNTKGEGEKASEDFWVKAEKLLYTALIAFIWYEGDEEEKNLNTLLDLLNESETREEDETYQNPVDMMFQELEERDPQHFAVRQYKKYKMAAGKTAKSILISCGARLAPFDIAELREIMSYDEMELDKIGDRKTALFLIMSDTDTTFNFVIAMLQSQLFNLLCDKADDEYGGRLPVHVRVIADEFANIGQIPQFDKLIATIRSREISASIILQSQSQLKAMYKDSADTILGNCDTTLFLGGKEKTTLKEMSELLGKHEAVSKVHLGADALGNITRINNLLDSYPEKLSEAQQRLETVYEQLANAKEEVGKPFPKEEELNQKLERLSELNALLNMDEREDAETEVSESDEKEERPTRGSIHEKLQIYKEKSQRESETGKENRKRDFGLE